MQYPKALKSFRIWWMSLVGRGSGPCSSQYAAVAESCVL